MVSPRMREEDLPIMESPITRNDVLRLLVPQPNPVILDLGANEGQSTREFLELYPEAIIHAFEPAPATFAKLQGNVGDKPNVTPVNQAIGSVAGTATFHINSYDQTNSLLPLTPDGPYGRRNVAPEEEVEVTVTTLDDYAAKVGLKHVNFCKIDTQGCSQATLEGARSLLDAGRIDVLQIELLFARFYERSESFSDIEKALGKEYRFYTLIATDNHHVGEAYVNHRTGETMHVDALYVRQNISATTNE